MATFKCPECGVYISGELPQKIVACGKCLAASFSVAVESARKHQTPVNDPISIHQYQSERHGSLAQYILISTILPGSCLILLKFLGVELVALFFGTLYLLLFLFLSWVVADFIYCRPHWVTVTIAAIHGLNLITISVGVWYQSISSATTTYFAGSILAGFLLLLSSLDGKDSDSSASKKPVMSQWRQRVWWFAGSILPSAAAVVLLTTYPIRLHGGIAVGLLIPALGWGILGVIVARMSAGTPGASSSC
ncbi:MAG: hypothetical protein ACRC8S_08010 [Fimbriiglobus sp.]